MKAAGIFWLILCGATAMGQTTYTPISNVGQSTADDDPVGIFSEGPLSVNAGIAVSFTTAGAASSFSAASISMANSSGGGTFALSLYTDNGGSPGTNLATLSGNANPVTAGIYTYTNASPLRLSANTMYWLVATNSAGSGTYDWCAAGSANLDAGSGWALGTPEEAQIYYEEPYDSGWEGFQGYPEYGYPQFSVTATNPQLPSVSIAQPIVLTFPAPGFPSTLQQNSSLATMNWVNVTNATLSGVISNQDVFVLPLGSRGMFYRLISSP